jgi:chromosome segregation ATPase
VTPEIEQKLKALHLKIEALVRSNSTLQKENNALNEALKESRHSSQNLIKSIEKVQNQLDIAKYSQAGMTPDEKKNFEKKISRFVKEIDKCIALLSV